MRTKRETLYDKAYYRIERFIYDSFLSWNCRKSLRGIKFGPEFYRAYREKVVPYWKQFGVRPGKLWYKHYYSQVGVVDPRYIPNYIHNNKVVPYFDNPIYERQMEDKNLYSVLFPGLHRPETVFKHFSSTIFNSAPESYCTDDFTPIPREEAVARCLAGGRFIIKPTRDTGGGADVKAFSAEDGEAAIAALFDAYAGVDYIVQRFVSQHPSLAEFNSNTLNTIRVMTLVYRDKAYLLAGIIRIGSPENDVDNIAKGGYEVGIHLEDGTLKRTAFTYKDGLGAEQTASGKVFDGFRIPSWDAIRTTALETALRLPHLKLIGWDFAVDEDGNVVLIEINCHFAQTQESNGPTFGDMTDEILAEVFQERMKKKHIDRKQG